MGGPLKIDYEAPPPEYMRAYLPPSAAGWGTNGVQNEEWKLFLGPNWAAYSSDLMSAGGFDTSVGPGQVAVGQETEMQRRLLAQGCEQVFVSGATAYHYVPSHRCSKRWAINRYYRMGTAHGLRKMLSDEYDSFPWWTVKEGLRFAGLAGKQYLSGNSRAAFDAVIKANRIRGIFIGALQGLRQKKTQTGS